MSKSERRTRVRCAVRAAERVFGSGDPEPSFRAGKPRPLGGWGESPPEKRCGYIRHFCCQDETNVTNATKKKKKSIIGPFGFSLAWIWVER